MESRADVAVRRVADPAGEDERKLAALFGLAANFGKAFEKDVLRLWMRLLAPYSAQEVEEAVLCVVEGYEFKTLPPYAVLRKHLPDRGAVPSDREEAKRLAAEAEWGNLLDDIRAKGWMDPPLLHPTTAYVLRGMGGWSAACQWKTDECHFRRKEFIEAWVRADGNVEIMSLGAKAVEERRRAQKALGEDDYRTLRKITRDAVKRCELEARLDGTDDRRNF